MDNFEKMSHLAPEVKILIVEGQTLVNKTRESMKGKSPDIGLTGKFQLRDDCRAVENKIKALGKKNAKQKNIKDLELAIIRLRTTAGALLEVE